MERGIERGLTAVPRSSHRAHVAQIRPQYDTMVCGSVIHKYVALVVGLGPEAGSPGRTTRGQPPSRSPIPLSGAPGAAPSAGRPVGPSAEHLKRLQVLIEPSLAVSAKPHFLGFPLGMSRLHTLPLKLNRAIGGNAKTHVHVRPFLAPLCPSPLDYMCLLGSLAR